MEFENRASWRVELCTPASLTSDNDVPNKSSGHVGGVTGLGDGQEKKRSQKKKLDKSSLAMLTS